MKLILLAILVVLNSSCATFFPPMNYYNSFSEPDHLSPVRDKSVTFYCSNFACEPIVDTVRKSLTAAGASDIYLAQSEEDIDKLKLKTDLTMRFRISARPIIDQKESNYGTRFQFFATITESMSSKLIKSLDFQFDSFHVVRNILTETTLARELDAYVFPLISPWLFGEMKTLKYSISDDYTEGVKYLRGPYAVIRDCTIRNYMKLSLEAESKDALSVAHFVSCFRTFTLNKPKFLRAYFANTNDKKKLTNVLIKLGAIRESTREGL